MPAKSKVRWDERSIRWMQYFTLACSLFWASDVLARQNDERLAVGRQPSRAPASVYASERLASPVASGPVWYSSPAVISMPKGSAEVREERLPGQRNENFAPALKYNQSIPHSWVY